jgi:Holliday junction resolvase RusA-like endonuclease
MFSPSKANQNSFRDAFQEALQQAPTGIFRCNGNPCSITVKFYFPCPKHHFIVGPAGKDWPLKANAPKFVTHAPDIDNCVKLVLDALQGTAFQNDSSVIHVTTTKMYDHTQQFYREETVHVGTTLIKVVEMDPNKPAQNCSCLCCAK